MNPLTRDQLRALLIWIRQHRTEIQAAPYRVAAEKASRELGFFVHSMTMGRLTRQVQQQLIVVDQEGRPV